MTSLRKAGRPKASIALGVWLVTHAAGAAVYYCGPGGDDQGPGSASRPWATIQRALNAAAPGDTIMVLAGVYNERVNTVRGGTADARIVCKAVGRAVVRGWVVNHPYVSIEGFEISGHSAANTLDAMVRVNNGGDQFEMRNCIVRDGIQRAGENVYFEADVPAIYVPTGGLVGLGFAPGQSVYVGLARPGITVTNRGQYSITNVTDERLYVTEPLVDEGPTAAYLSASLVFGLYLAPGTERCFIVGNTFTNLGYDALLITGSDQIIESNLVVAVNGWDAMHFGGTNLVFRFNVFGNSGLVVYQTSPDVWENYAVPYANVVFSNNFVLGFSGVLSSQKAPYTMHSLRITRNVFVDVGRFTLTQRDTRIENNTFLRVARRSNPVVARASHAIRIDGTRAGSNIVVLNNAFVDCGEPSGAIRPEHTGWYEVVGPSINIRAEGNFVAGAPPTFGAKTNWTEAPELNGGDPGFVNIDDPLGPDGLPFTADDGLRPRADSRLLGAGVGGVTIGAYELPYVERVAVEAQLVDGSTVRVRWPDSVWDWTLEWATDPGGPWSSVPVAPVRADSGWKVELPMETPARWFRLRR